MKSKDGYSSGAGNKQYEDNYTNIFSGKTKKLYCNYCRKLTEVVDNDCVICGFSFTNTELDKLKEVGE